MAFVFFDNGSGFQGETWSTVADEDGVATMKVTGRPQASDLTQHKKFPWPRTMGVFVNIKVKVADDLNLHPHSFRPPPMPDGERQETHRRACFPSGSAGNHKTANEGGHPGADLQHCGQREERARHMVHVRDGDEIWVLRRNTNGTKTWKDGGLRENLTGYNLSVEGKFDPKNPNVLKGSSDKGTVHITWDLSR
jgi:hypothetical protein